MYIYVYYWVWGVHISVYITDVYKNTQCIDTIYIGDRGMKKRLGKVLVVYMYMEVDNRYMNMLQDTFRGMNK